MIRTTTYSSYPVNLPRKPMHMQPMKSAIKYLISAVVMFVILLPISKRLNSSIINTVILISSGVLVYSGMLIALHDDFFIGNLKSVLRKLNIKL